MAAGSDELEQLYRERFAGFAGALAALVGDAHVAEECVQAAFVTARPDRSLCAPRSTSLRSTPTGTPSRRNASTRSCLGWGAADVVVFPA
jgi:hypothetical protein